MRHIYNLYIVTGYEDILINLLQYYKQLLFAEKVSFEACPKYREDIQVVLVNKFQPKGQTELYLDFLSNS